MSHSWPLKYNFSYSALRGHVPLEGKLAGLSNPGLHSGVPELTWYFIYPIGYNRLLINKVVFVSTLSNGGIFPKVHHNIWQFQMLFYKIRGTSCYSYINSSLGHAVTLRGFILDLAMISETFWSHCTLNSGIRAFRCNFWPWYISICTIDLKVVLSRLYPWDLTFL